jgi:hypothetical protein
MVDAVTLWWTEVGGAAAHELEQSATADCTEVRVIRVRGHFDALGWHEFDRGRFFRVRAVGFPRIHRGAWSNTVEVRGPRG